MKDRAIFLAIFLSLILVSSRQAQPRDRLVVAELMGHEFQMKAPLDNRFFMPLGTGESARQEFEGSLSVPEFLMHNAVGTADSARPWEYFPGFSMDFFTHGNVLVPVSREVIQPPGDRNYWRIVVSPGTVWSEPGDSGLSRASFPFALVNNTFNDVHNGLATFAYDETRVSSLFLQVTQETSPVFKADFWGVTPVVYRTHRFENRKLLSARFDEEEKRQIPILPFSALAARVDAALLDTFTAGIEREEISATGLIWNGTLYLHPCCTRTGDYPYGRYMRHAAYSLTKAMGALIAMLRLAEKYGEGVFDLEVADYVEITAARDGWKSVTFADALNMATGVGDHMPERVEPNTMHGDEDQPKFMDFLRARSRQEKMDIAFSYGDYPWGPGEVARYNSINTFILSAAMDGFLKSKEGPEADIWDMVLTEVFRPIGIFHAPIMRTIEPDGSRGLPLFGYGLYPTVDDVAKLSILLQNGGRHQGRQLLHSGRLAEALYQTQVIGLPTGEKNEYGEVTYHLAFNGLPWRCKDGRIHRIPVSTGFGGNHWVLLPNDITTFRFCDANQYGVGSMIEVAEGIGVTQTAQAVAFFTCDGRGLFISSQRPLPGTREIKKDSDIWIIRKNKEEWGEPVHGGKPLNSDFDEDYPTISKSNKLYFSSNRDGNYDIYVSDFSEKGFAEPHRLDSTINTNYFEGHPFIAADESYLIFSSDRPGELGQGDLYISFKGQENEWLEPINMGDKINSSFHDVAPYVSPDGKYLFFCSFRPNPRSYGKHRLTFMEIKKLLDGTGNGHGDIYWVSAKIIEELRPKE